jgi:AcrR family transcriptional regulator
MAEEKKRAPASVEGKPDRRQELILAAFHSIASKGFEGLRVRDVAAQVGINGATLHHYFPTKEVLIQAVAEYATQRLHIITDETTLTPAQQLHDHLTRLYQIMHSEPDFFVVLAELGLRAQRDPIIDYLVTQQSQWHGYIVSMLKAGIVEGTWPDTIDPVGIASAIIMLLEGSSLWVRGMPDRVEQAIRQLEAWLQIAEL